MGGFSRVFLVTDAQVVHNSTQFDTAIRPNYQHLSVRYIMVSEEHNEWCESLEKGDCVRSDNGIVEVERKGSGYIVVANEPDVTKRYREFDSLKDLPADAFDYDALGDEDANLIDRTIIEEEPSRYSLDRLQRTLRHKYNYELPADAKPTANPSAYK